MRHNEKFIQLLDKEINRTVIPTTRCLELAFLVHPNFRYQPSSKDRDQFHIIFPDGSGTTLQNDDEHLNMILVNA